VIRAGRTGRAGHALVAAALVVGALAPTRLAAQTPAPARAVTLLSQVRDAIAAHDLARAQALVQARRAAEGNTPEVIEAVSWLARGAQAEGQLDSAERYVDEVERLAKAALRGRPVDDDARLANAIGAAIEVEGQATAARGARSEAIAYLEKQLAAYRATSLAKRIQKNINLLTLEGHPAPALDLSEFVGRKPPPVADLKGQVAVLFFWAHWCPDCKIEGPILAKLYEKYRSRGLAVVAPTQRFGYTTRGAAAAPDEELRYIVQIRDQYYPFLADLPVPLAVANHERYGVSSTPTVVIVDRAGIIRLYHPGRLTEEELEQHLVPLLAAKR
jgi:thiol-disulfide isomerase/thioredoxin